MLIIYSLVPGCIWLVVSVLIYTGLLSAVRRRLDNIKLLLLNLIGSVFLSPGIAVGHGILPFPGGLAFLFGEHSARNSDVLIFNFAWWAVTFITFSIYSSEMKEPESPR